MKQGMLASATHLGPLQAARAELDQQHCRLVVSERSQGAPAAGGSAGHELWLGVGHEVDARSQCLFQHSWVACPGSPQHPVAVA